MELTKKKGKLNDVENCFQKIRTKSIFNEARNEIYVLEPNRKHSEMLKKYNLQLKLNNNQKILEKKIILN